MDTAAAIANSLWKVTVIGLASGAGLPLIFALGIRSLNTVSADGTVRRNPALTVLGYLLIGIVAIAVITGIVYIAKEFILHTFDISLFGAEKKAK